MKRYTIAVIVEIDAEDNDDAYAKGVAIGEAGHDADPTLNLTSGDVWTRPPLPAETRLLGER